MGWPIPNRPENSHPIRTGSPYWYGCFAPGSSLTLTPLGSLFVAAPLSTSGPSAGRDARPAPHSMEPPHPAEVPVSRATRAPYARSVVSRRKRVPGIGRFVLARINCRRWLSPRIRVGNTYAVRAPASPPCWEPGRCASGVSPYALVAGRSKSWPQDRQITVPITTMRRGLEQSGQRSASAVQPGSAAWHWGHRSTCSPPTTARAQGDFPLTGSV